MRIADLRDAMRKVDATGTIISVDAPRTVNLKMGGEAQVAEAQLKDESGTITLSLWDEQVEQVVPGAVVSIVNGYTNSFRGEVRLAVGKYGRLVVQAVGSDLDEPQFGEV